MKIRKGKPKGWEIMISGIVLMVMASFVTYIYVHKSADEEMHRMKQNIIDSQTEGDSRSPVKQTFNLSLSTHYDPWENWEDALLSILNRKDAQMIDNVGVAAGRPEWTYFRWKGRDENWSGNQRKADKDLLETAAKLYQNRKSRVAAIIDLFGPNYIEHHPDVAAVRFDGSRSELQVSLVELVEGEYGKLVLEMVAYICDNYEIDIINLTEVSYYHYSFSDDDLRSYEAFSGRIGWPLDERGLIDKDNPMVWEWKSAMMEKFIQKVAVNVHSKGKELYVDVPVSWDDYSRNGSESGLDYRRVLHHADRIIVWNYFSLEEIEPERSANLARYLTTNFPTNDFYISIGLWGGDGQVKSGDLREAVSATLDGGGKNIWITPNHFLSDRHWKALLGEWKPELGK